MPRLRPVSVQGTTTPTGAHYQLAHVTTDDDRMWDVKVGLHAAAGAALEQSDALTRLLTKRLPYAVPRLEGLTVTPDGATVAVFPHLPGTTTTWRSLEPGSGLARSIGTSLAALHDIDPRVVDEAGLPTYDADAYRARKLAALDRAATSGQVPARLLGRWERALEEVTLWKFAACTTHGPLESGDVLVDKVVTAITGWEHAGVSDPAEDFAPLFVLASSGAFDTVIEAYAGARRDAPDPHLTRRIRLAAELQRVTALTDAVAVDDDDLVARRVAALRRLDEQTADDDQLMPPTPGRRRPPAAPTEDEPVDPADMRVVEVHDAGEEDETVEIPVDGESESSSQDEGPEVAEQSASPEDEATSTAAGGEQSSSPDATPESTTEATTESASAEGPEAEADEPSDAEDDGDSSQTPRS